MKPNYVKHLTFFISDIHLKEPAQNGSIESKPENQPPELEEASDLNAPPKQKSAAFLGKHFFLIFKYLRIKCHAQKIS